MKAAAVTVMVTVMVAAAVINAQPGHGAAFAPEGGPAQRARAAAAPPTHTAPAPAPAPAARFVPIIMIPVMALVNGIMHLPSIIEGILAQKNLAPSMLRTSAPLFGFYDDKLWGRQPVTKNSPRGVLAAPTLFKFAGAIDEPQDTWIDLRGWGTGAVFVNGFKLGQYSYLGPDNALLWPAPLQRPGRNQVVVLELFKAPADFALTLFDEPIVG